MAVGVLNHRRDPTYSCGAGTRDKIFAAAVAGILKVDMTIDHPREDPQTRRIAALTRLQAICGDPSDHTLLNVEILVLLARPADQRSPFYGQIVFHALLRFLFEKPVQLG